MSLWSQSSDKSKMYPNYVLRRVGDGVEITQRGYATVVFDLDELMDEMDGPNDLARYQVLQKAYSFMLKGTKTREVTTRRD